MRNISAIRNRLWTLLDDSYQVLRKAGFYLFGDRVDDFVLLLGARQRTPGGAEAPVPTPETDPGADPSPEGGSADPPK